VRVRAHNRAPEPSTWSAWSAGMVPARAPEAPAAPTTERLEPVGAQAQMRVSWTPPANNGDQISGYRLNVQGGGGSRTIDVPAGQTSQALALDASTSDYTFSVAAENKAGWGATSAPSAPRRAFVPPDAPTNVRATEGDNRVSVTYGAADGNGANAGELRYEYSVNNGPWRADWDGTTITSGVGNGGSYSVRVRAYTDLDGVRYDGAASAASNAVQPYGAVRAPTVSANASGTSITYRWSPPAENGRAITRIAERRDEPQLWSRRDPPHRGAGDRCRGPDEHGHSAGPHGRPPAGAGVDDEGRGGWMLGVLLPRGQHPEFPGRQLHGRLLWRRVEVQQLERAVFDPRQRIGPVAVLLRLPRQAGVRPPRRVGRRRSDDVVRPGRDPETRNETR
jgi:hypothetical protein